MQPPREPPIATLADGSRLRGVAIGDVDAYRGVPFALPPLGERRFAPPAPLPRQPWGITPLNVTEYRPNCAQPHDEWVPAWPGLNNTFDEDCLYLNVFAPRDGGGAARAGQLPVLVFLFGGGWTEGGAADQQLYAWQSVLQTGDDYTHKARTCFQPQCVHASSRARLPPGGARRIECRPCALAPLRPRAVSSAPCLWCPQLQPQALSARATAARAARRRSSLRAAASGRAGGRRHVWLQVRRRGLCRHHQR